MTELWSYEDGSSVISVIETNDRDKLAVLYRMTVGSKTVTTSTIVPISKMNELADAIRRYGE